MQVTLPTLISPLLPFHVSFIWSRLVLMHFILLQCSFSEFLEYFTSRPALPEDSCSPSVKFSASRFFPSSRLLFVHGFCVFLLTSYVAVFFSLSVNRTEVLCRAQFSFPSSGINGCSFFLVQPCTIQAFLFCLTCLFPFTSSLVISLEYRCFPRT